MYDLTRLLRRLSRQGVPTERIMRELRRDASDMALTSGEMRMLRQLTEDDGILLSGSEWRALRYILDNARVMDGTEEYYLYSPLTIQRLRREPEMKVHKCGSDCDCSRLPIRYGCE